MPPGARVQHGMALNSIEEIIEDIRQGRMVILMDDEDRENEGDLVMAAEHCTPEAINFMAKFGRGLICMPMTRERCEQLGLPLMVQQNASGFGTKFTLSIEAREGVTTGHFRRRPGPYRAGRGGQGRQAVRSGPAGPYFPAHGGSGRRAPAEPATPRLPVISRRWPDASRRGSSAR